MRTHREWRLRETAIAAVASAILGTATLGLAQTNDEVNSGIQFNFTPPGARSLGMGGAFLSLATDATAAVTNPGGLTTLDRSEFSVEGLFAFFTHEIANRGRDPRFGSASGRGLDTIDGIEHRTSGNNSNGVSFLSFVYASANNRWSIGGYRHELANYMVGSRKISGGISGYSNFKREAVFFTDESGVDRRIFPLTSELALGINSYGVSGAYKVWTEGARHFSLGGSVFIADFSIDSVTRRYFPRGPACTAEAIAGGDRAFRDQCAANRFGPPDFSGENVAFIDTQAGDDQAIGFSFGFLWQPVPAWRLGGSYRPGQQFGFGASKMRGEFFGPTRGLVEKRLEPCSGSRTPQCGAFTVPDIYGVGISYIRDAWTFAFDYNRVAYSQMTDPIGQLVREDDRVRAEDGSQAHAGVEYSFGQLRLRGGAWYDPDHKFRFVGEPSGTGRTLDEQLREATVFQPGTGEMHYSFGVGLGRNDGRLTFDAAFDYSRLITALTAMLTVQLPGR